MFAKAYISTFFASLMQGLTTILLPLLFGRIWDKTEFGVFCYILVLVGLFQVIVDYGFNIQTVKAINDHPQTIQDTLKKQIHAKNLVVSLAFILLLLYTLISQHTVQNNFLLLIWLFSLAATAYSYSVFLTYPFQALKNFKQANKMIIYNNLIYLLFVLPLLFLSHVSLNLVAVLFLLGRLCGLYINFSLANNILKPNKLLSFSYKKETWHTVLQGLPFALLFFFGLAYFQADSFFVKHFLGYDAIATYQTGIRFVMMAAFMTSIFNVVAFPYLNELRNNEHLYSLKQTTLDLLTFYGALIALMLMVFSKVIILILGKNFTELAPYLPLFGLIILIRNFGNAYSLLMTILSHQEFRSLVLFIACCTAIISNLILIPRFHLWGALTAALLTLLVINSNYVLFVWFKLKKVFINGKIIGIFCYYLTVMGIYYSFPVLFKSIGFIFLLLYVILFFQKKEIMTIFSLT